MKLTNRHLFLLSMLVGVAIMVTPAVYDRLSRGRAPKTTVLTSGVDVTAQITEKQLRAIQQAGYKTLIDFRPDNEVDGQTSSKVIEREAVRNQLAFFYLPIPQGETVPDDAVRKLAEILSSSPPPFLLYCRSGRRATRAWSLAEASRRSGRSAEEISQPAGKNKGGKLSGDAAKK